MLCWAERVEREQIVMLLGVGVGTEPLGYDKSVLDLIPECSPFRSLSIEGMYTGTCVQKAS